MKKLLRWGGLAFVAWWIITAPSAAGHEVHSLGGLATHAASSISTMLSSI